MPDFDWTPYMDEKDGSKWAADNPGDELVGIVEDVETRSGQYGDTAVVTVIERDSGRSVELFAGATELRRKLAAANVQKGGKLAVRYDGAERLSSGNTMKRYSVRYEPPTERSSKAAAEDTYEPDEAPF